MELGDRDDWLACISHGNRQTINKYLDKNTDLESIASLWVDRIGSDNNFPFGSLVNKNKFGNSLFVEMNDFICYGDNYKDLRDQVKSLVKTNKVQVVSLLSASIGVKFGLAPAILTPYVSLILAAAAQLGRSAWCRKHGMAGVDSDAKSDNESEAQEINSSQNGDV